MNKHISRRAATNAALAAAENPTRAMPALAETEVGDTPILRLFRQHRAILEAAGKHVCTAAGKDEDTELDILFYNRADAIEAEMMALPCTCAADFAAKVIVDTVRGGLFSDWETGAIWVEARALTGIS